MTTTTGSDSDDDEGSSTGAEPPGTTTETSAPPRTGDETSANDTSTSGAVETTGDPPPPQFTCTQIHSAPQTVSRYFPEDDWFTDGIFESYVGAGRWQRTVEAPGINHWENPDDEVWGPPLKIAHPCDESSDAPDRIVQILWGRSPFESADDWLGNIRGVVPTIHEKVPSAQSIVLMPAAGRDCTFTEEEVPGYSYSGAQFDFITEAVDMYVASGEDQTVSAGLYLWLPDCDDYRRPYDRNDLLTPEAARWAAEEYGEFFAEIP